MFFIVSIVFVWFVYPLSIGYYLPVLGVLTSLVVNSIKPILSYKASSAFVFFSI